MIKYSFNKDIQVLEVIYHGEIRVEDIISHAQFVSENKELPRKLNILTDSRNAQYSFSLNEGKKLIKLLKQSLRNYEFIKDAFLHSSPRETAFSTLLEIEQQYTNYAHKIFSTREAALEWLK